jgi:hypothetical protein
MINRPFIMAVLAAALLLLVACNNATPTVSIPTLPPTGTAMPATSASSMSTSKAGPTFVPAAAIMPDTQSGRDSLAALRSYRSRFIYSFEGKNEQGELQRGVVAVLQEVRNTNGDRHTRWTITGDPVGSNSAGAGASILDWYTVDGLTYLYTADSELKCASVSSDKGILAPVTNFSLSDVIGGIENAQLIETGPITNEVMSDHYTFDQPDAAAYGYNSAAGDVWVAQTGEYVIRYIGHATGENGPLGKLTDGTFEWEYNLEEVNKLEAIILPEECEDQKPATDIPLPSNATNKINFGQLTTFNSPDKFTEVAAFFSKVLPEHGWTAGEVYSRGDQAKLNFTKDGRKLLITIMLEQSGGSTVVLEVAP